MIHAFIASTVAHCVAIHNGKIRAREAALSTCRTVEEGDALLAAWAAQDAQSLAETREPEPSRSGGGGGSWPLAAVVGFLVGTSL